MLTNSNLINKNRVNLIWPIAFLIVLVSFTLALVFLIVSCFSSGIDLTDESFYLVHSSAPESVRASLTSFGFYTKFIFDLVNQDVFWFRVSGLLLLLCASNFFSWALNKYISIRVLANNKLLEYSWIVLLTISAIFYYCTWLVTPSYNLLTLLSCLLVSASSLRLLTSEVYKIKKDLLSRHDYFHLVIIVFGLHLCFMAKASGVLLLYPLAVLALFKTYKIKLAIFVSIAILLGWLLLFSVHVIVFDKSLSNFLDRILFAWELNATLMPTLKLSYYIIKLESYGSILLTNGVPIILFFFLTISFCWKFLRYEPMILTKKNFEKYEVTSKLLIFLVLFLSIHMFELLYGRGIGKVGLLLLCFLVVWYWLFESEYIPSITEKISKIEKYLSILWILAFSLAFSIGSSIHPVSKMSYSLIFIIGCFNFMLRTSETHKKKQNLEYVYIALIFGMLVININYARLHPYRLIIPINEQKVEVLIPIDGNRHKVDPITAKYINDLSISAKKSGWELGTPLLDFTGGTPFASYFLKAKVVVTPWYYGGNKSSERWLFKVLSHADVNDLNNAWLLLAPNGELKIDESILLSIGGYKNKQYEKVGSFTTGFRNETQELWKPIKTNHIQ